MLGKPSASCNRTPGRPQHLGVIDLTITIIHEITVYYIIYISFILLTGFIQAIVFLTKHTRKDPATSTRMFSETFMIGTNVLSSIQFEVVFTVSSYETALQ